MRNTLTSNMKLRMGNFECSHLADIVITVLDCLQSQILVLWPATCLKLELLKLERLLYLRLEFLKSEFLKSESPLRQKSKWNCYLFLSIRFYLVYDITYTQNIGYIHNN